jgi:hypothetical protein
VRGLGDALDVLPFRHGTNQAHNHKRVTPNAGRAHATNPPRANNKQNNVTDGPPTNPSRANRKPNNKPNQTLVV